MHACTHWGHTGLGDLPINMYGAFLTDAHQAKSAARRMLIGALAQHQISCSQQACCQWLTSRGNTINTINIEVDELVVIGENTGEGRYH
jgi:hypothetical protein